MKARILLNLFFCGFLLFVMSCVEEPVTHEKGILSFGFLKKHHSFLEQDFPGLIKNDTITVVLPKGIPMTSLIASFTTSPRTTVKVGSAVQYSGITRNNFTKTIRYVVTTDNRSTRSYTVVILHPIPPVASFEVLTSNGAIVPSKVTIKNTSTDASQYQWYFGDGTTSTLAEPEITYRSPRRYTITLIVSNAFGSDTVSRTISILPIPKSLMVWLVTPQGETFNPRYYEAVKSAVLEMQQYYKDQLGTDKTFVLNPMMVDTIRGLHDRMWYSSYNGSVSGNDPRFYPYFNTFDEMKLLMGSNFVLNEYTYLVYVAGPGEGAGATGFCVMGEQDLLGLLGENPENRNVQRWIGGGAHELGHALGLNHPANQSSQALMWTGYSIYPNCVLTEEDKDILTRSPFIR
jgi:PKD repeat protein